jgi:mono/diheme cytochrome c family protein
MLANSVRKNVLVVCAALTAATLVIIATPHIAAQQAQSPWNGAYSTAQATRGEALYARHCASCHNKDLTGTDRGPAVTGPGFAARWSSRPLGELLDFVQTQMPLHSPGAFTRHQNADIVAFMLRRHGVTSGDRDLWVAGPEGGSPPLKRSPDFGAVATRSTKRAEAFYTEAQAHRGRVVFNRNCAFCHGMDASRSTPEDLKRPLPSTFAGHFIERIVNGLVVYPNVFALYSKLQSMPVWNPRTINPQQRVDVIAYILQANGLPSGAEEIPVDTDAMRLMMLNEPGFERLFNGKDFTGWNITYGYGCGYGEGGCAKHGPLDVVRVENQTIVCECHLFGHVITDKKYKDFTLRFETRYERPADMKPFDDEELFSGGSGYKIFSDLATGKYVEVEGRHRDLMEIIAPGGTHVMGQVDLAAKRRAIRPLGEWNAIEISAKNGEIHARLNGVPISSAKAEDYNYADFKDGGHIMFQTEGAKMFWRNIRVRVD